MMIRGGSSSSSSSSSRCQECGNQSKKDCEYMRCRTCCKSRGFQCATHIKSTWIPLSLRRPRQPNFFQHSNLETQQSALPVPKRTKPFNLSSSTNSSGTGMQSGDQFPAEANLMATFRCVRMMSSEDNVVEQCAYQTAVNIGGHVFKGVLYDQGPSDNDQQHHDHDHHPDRDRDRDRDRDPDHQPRNHAAPGCYNIADPW
ncbi:protein SHI RELATED SEQUENCE 1-like [Impatiens glandulifera]|uniref:protein SHI RELATED SEQUENCE 1-like n=1 Tax=Impatiens glandulifera TaxID=253017 RepID=UPI001FB0F108|nr:protein SHI RELATED SEQUENCE 1-like [Impatiens glandulifera]